MFGLNENVWIHLLWAVPGLVSNCILETCNNKYYDWLEVRTTNLQKAIIEGNIKQGPLNVLKQIRETFIAVKNGQFKNIDNVQYRSKRGIITVSCISILTFDHVPVTTAIIQIIFALIPMFLLVHIYVIRKGLKNLYKITNLGEI